MGASGLQLRIRRLEILDAKGKVWAEDLNRGTVTQRKGRAVSMAPVPEVEPTQTSPSVPVMEHMLCAGLLFLILLTIQVGLYSPGLFSLEKERISVTRSRAKMYY